MGSVFSRQVWEVVNFSLYENIPFYQMDLSALGALGGSVKPHLVIEL